MPIASLSSMPPHVAHSDARGITNPRLERAAREFEAVMLKELVAPMNRPGALFKDGDSDEGGVMGEYAAESLAGALSSMGGLGIADRIMKAFPGSGKCSESVVRTQSWAVEHEINRHESLK